jgi:hypothetical protein
VSENKAYVLAVYQSDTEVNKEEIKIQSSPVSSKTVGLAVGLTLSIIMVFLRVVVRFLLKRNEIRFKTSPTDNHNKTYYNTSFASTAKEYDNPYEAVPTTAYEDVKIYSALDNFMKN